MIRVNDNYVVLVDTLSYKACVDTHRVTKKGKPVYNTIGYYSNLESALFAIVENMNAKKLEDGVHTLTEAIEIIKANNKILGDMLKEVCRVGGVNNAT